MSLKEIYLECDDGKSYKFYNLFLDGPNVLAVYGRIGCPGTENLQPFESDEEAEAYFNWQEQDKLKKGYRHTEREYKLRKSSKVPPGQLWFKFKI